VEGRVSKIDQVKGYVWKSYQKQCIRIAVDRIIKHTLSLDQFLKRAFLLVRFLIGEISFLEI